MSELVKRIELLPHQIRLLQSTKSFVALCGGFGCGKSYAIGAKSYQLACDNFGFQGAIISRSSKQLYDFLMPEVEKFWGPLGINAQYKWQDGNKLILGNPNGTHSTVHLLTTENEAYKRWSGGNLAWACVDEIDTMPKSEEVWSYIGDRVRTKAPLVQIACASTPEGYKFLYNFFEKQPNEDSTIDDRELIKGCTFDNPHNDKGYVWRQIRTRNPLQLRAYIYGEFCNLEGSLVYYNYVADYGEGNWTRFTLDTEQFKEHTIHWGGDFNKNINPFVAHVIDGNKVYALRTIRGLANVDDVIREIKLLYPDRKHKFYPDASDSSAITQLNKHFGEMNVITADPLREKRIRKNTDNGNPDVGKRVTSFHQMILDSGSEERRYFVNPETCSDLDRGLRYQTYNEKDEPDKASGLDHDVDAAGYFAHRKFPYVEKAEPRIYSF